MKISCFDYGEDCLRWLNHLFISQQVQSLQVSVVKSLFVMPTVFLILTILPFMQKASIKSHFFKRIFLLIPIFHHFQILMEKQTIVTLIQLPIVHLLRTTFAHIVLSLILPCLAIQRQCKSFMKSLTLRGLWLLISISFADSNLGCDFNILSCYHVSTLVQTSVFNNGRYKYLFTLDPPFYIWSIAKFLGYL